jgi:hypothetical protein
LISGTPWGISGRDAGARHGARAADGAYAPGGEEQALITQPGFARHPAGEIVGWQRSGEPG